jgi:long-chain acyl-CoA synthetase
VIGVPHEEWGETILAVVALKPNAAKDEAALREFCKQRIAGYKVPKKIEFVDALPKTGAGKILKKELREKYWEGIERRIG